MQKKAVFLDRDGVINEERGYVWLRNDLVLLPGVEEALRQIRNAGYLTIVITNQSGIAKGLYTKQDVKDLHCHLEQDLKAQGAHIDAFYFCPHHPEGKVAEYSVQCDCRKPGNGLVLQAANDWDIDLKSSYFIGDSERDIIAGKKSGCTTFGVQTGHGFTHTVSQPDYLVKNLSEAVRAILNLK